jgi:hypothetical protein
MKYLLFFNLICISFAGKLCAQTTDPIQQWTGIVQTEDLPAIAAHIEQSNPSPWPKLISDISEGVKGNMAYKPTVIGNSLFAKIRAYEGGVPRTFADTEEAVSIYRKISVGLQGSGGYINLCLADAVNRLALARLTESLINDPRLVDKVNASFLTLNCTRFSTTKFVQMMQDELELKPKASVDLTNLQENEAQKQIFAYLGSNPNEAFCRYSGNQAGTSNLISKPDLGVLVMRMGETDIIAQVVLAALIDFIHHGGQYSQIRLDDVRPFRAVMSGREHLYKSDIMGIPQTNVGYLFGVMEELKRDNSNNMFVITALQ